MSASSKKQRNESTSTTKNTSPTFSQSFSQSFSQAESQSSAQNTPINKKSYAQAKQMAEKSQQQSNKVPFNNRAQVNKRNEFGQQKQFFRSKGPSNFKRTAFKQKGEVDPYSPDLAPMNIFENQVIPTGIHNFSKCFRPNLAAIRVLLLMKFIPKT